MRVARFRCPESRETFSLLPDCLSSRVVGSLDEAEQVVLKVGVSRSVEQAAGSLRPDIGLPGAVRWVRRRLQGVRAALVALITLFPGQLGTVAQLHAVREFLGEERSLVALREIGAAHLVALPRPLGFGPPWVRAKRCGRAHQHETGPDPPGPPEI
jgi:hypothetical protein